ncbi:MAG: DUF58 domain-containing protein [Bacteroidia bacterium]|nr:DUF58 domain-containing protein [Bacteroidia bacterium]
MFPFLRSLFFTTRFYLLMAAGVCLLVLAHLLPPLLPAVQIGCVALGIGVLIELLTLYTGGQTVVATRTMSDRFSIGDFNPVTITLESRYRFAVRTTILDELPVQFQVRESQVVQTLRPGEQITLRYELRPVTRGVYAFGRLLIYVTGQLGLVQRRLVQEASREVPVYPSYIQMRKYQLLAISDRLSDVGVKKVRRIGHTSEFDQIKSYVGGDDVRTINWKATARSGSLMVNQYTDERAQHVYCLLDKSRAMKMPFEGMSLLDYAINTALVVSNIALYRQDRAGLVTFAEKIHDSLPATANASQMSQILELLYHQETTFPEADFGRLYAFVKRKIPQRSLLLLFTDFTTVAALERQLPFLQKIAQAHLLLVIFFENTELTARTQAHPEFVEDIYVQAIAEQFVLDKKQIVRTLEQHHIMAVLTPPEELTVKVLNKYIEIKSRGMA